MKDYKETLKDIVNIIKATEKSDIGFVNICSYLDANCPELMKSKDDRIKEKIIATIHLYYGEPLEDEAKEMIDWLEKQGEQKSQRMISAEAKEALFDFKNDIQQEDSAPKTESDFLFKVKYEDKEYNVRRIFGAATFELYNESESNVYVDLDDCEIIRGGYGIKENGSLYPIKSATFSEQKSDDEAEPKFKVGDWVVRKDGEIFGNSRKFARITNIDDDKRHWFDSGTWLEKEDIRLWTIEDAKDCDILVDGYGDIGIFEKRYGVNWQTYCFIDNDGHLTLEGGSHGSFCCPATFEQRSLLFSKLKEAGYKWDSKNKNLIKI